MSLESLRELRRSGHRPADVIVIVGKPESSPEDSPRIVTVNRAGMDLRPLVGLPVHIIDVQRDAKFLLRILDDLEDLGATLLGAAGDYGQIGVSDEHAAAVQSYRRALCANW